jgi:CHAT domain-containing protein
MTIDERQTVLKQYLLGSLSHEPRQALEQILMTDGELFDELSAAEDELIDQYLAGDLSPSEVDMFENHFLGSLERQEKLRFAKAFRKFAASHLTAQPSVPAPIERLTSNWQQFFSASPWRVAAFAALILVAVLGVWQIYFHQSDVDKGLIALNSAYRAQRPLEARITKLDYAPFATTRGGGADRVNSLERERAERYLLDAVRDHPAAASHQALGKFYLANKEFDKAITQFEEALKADPNNAQIYADLGAGLLEKGKIEIEKSKSDKTGGESGVGIEYLTRSLETLKKALELNPNLLEALFNRALAYEANSLSGPAEADWREYLKRDSTSQWAHEASQRLRLIEEQRQRSSQTREQSFDRFLNAHKANDEHLAWELISQNHTSAGNVISNSLLDTYLSQSAKDQNEQALKLLAALSYAGALMARRGEDRYVSDLALLYRSIEPAKRPILVEARVEMEKGYQLFTMSRFNDAIVTYTKAKQLFDSVADVPESTFASYRIGHCYVLQPNSKKGRSIFEELLLTAQRKQFKWLLAQSFYQLANVQVGLSEYSRAIDYSNQALKLAENLNDSNGVVKSLIQLADEYRSLNNRNRSFSFLERSLIALNNGPLEPMQAWQSYIGISLNLSSFNFHSAALEFQKEALRLGIEMNRPLIKSRSYQYLGLTYTNLKMYDEARKQVQQAIEIGRTLQTETNGMEMIANASVQLGDIYRQMGNYGEAIAAYDQSLQLYGKLNFPYFSYAAHKGKLLSYISQEDDQSTDAEIHVVLDLFKQFREKITEQSQRNTFFDAQQYIYDLAIDYEYSRRKNFQRAFDYSESSRARSLHDLIQSGGEIVENGPIPELTSLSTSEARTFSEIQTKLPDNTSIVQYAVLSDKLLIWAVTPDKALVTEEVSIDAKDLSEKIRAYRAALEGTANVTDAEVSGQAKKLYEILIEPVEQVLQTTNLCIVPDKTLHYLPFAALVSPSTGNYLFKDHRLQLSPSSTLFLDYSRIAQSRAGTGDERLLSVGNPNFDRKAFPTLPGLPAADREAAEIAQYYNHRTRHVLVNNDATKRHIETEAPRADVMHIAAHYVADERSEMLSKLVLAAEQYASSGQNSSDGTMQASEIYKMNLPRMRLVVLSACQTGIERQYQGEGAIGLARPFLARGVPLVVASLWPVDSEATADLMIRFHRYRRQGHLPTAEALQLAQLDMLQSENATYHKPYCWASFVAIGGYTKY